MQNGLYLKRNGAGIRWHDLRHHACTYLHSIGGAIHEIQTAGGWKSRAMVERYHSLQADNAATDIRAKMDKHAQESKDKTVELNKAVG